MSTDIATPLLPYRISICGLEELAAHARTDVSHIVSILDPAWPDPETFVQYGPHRRIVYRFHDVVEVGSSLMAPTEQDVEAILDLGRELLAEPAQHLLIHCHAGVSRSTATAVILMAQNNPGRERDAFAELSRVRPRSWPNGLMMQIADTLLGREGALVAELNHHQLRVASRYPEFVELLARYGRAHEIPGLSEAQ